jgi:hypothetical protein
VPRARNSTRDDGPAAVVEANHVKAYPWPGWLIGVVFGLLISLPDAIITKAYLPILIVGTLGGLVIGGLIHGWRVYSLGAGAFRHRLLFI